jgi:hypothetical protein
MPEREYRVTLVIEATKKYKDFLEDIVFDYARVSDNIAYHLTYLEYLYQLEKQIPLETYPILYGLRIKTIITELASCAEVLIYDAITNLKVTDKWGSSTRLKLKPHVGFTILLEYALAHRIVDKQLNGRLHKLFDLRHKIHLTHGERDPFGFNSSLLHDSEKTLEDLLTHFLKTRSRGMSKELIQPARIPLPWKSFT